MFDAATWATYVDAGSASARAEAVRDSLGASLTVELRDGESLIYSGTFAGPMTAEDGSLSADALLSGLVGTGGTPDSATWTCRIRNADGRYVEGTFGPGGRFTWSGGALVVGQAVRLRITITPTAETPATLPSWLSGAEVNEWVAVPNGTPSLAAGLVPTVSGSMGSQKNMIEAWCGAFTDGSSFMIHGGGHADYGGNEVGAIDLTSETPAWNLLIERTPVADLLGGSNYYADGRPTSRHTYYGMWYVPSLNKMLRFNANMGFAYNGTPVGGSADVRTLDIDAFNLATNAWEPAAYGPMPAITGSGTTMAQDPDTGDVYAWDGAGGNKIYKWTAATNVAALAIDLAGTEGVSGAAVFDAVNQRLVRFFGGSASSVVYWDVATGTKNTVTLSGPGASALLTLGGSGGLGIAHDSLLNVAYVSNGTSLFRVQLDDFYVQQIMPTGASPVLATNGIWGKLKYISAINAIAYLSNWTNNLLVMRVA